MTEAQIQNGLRDLLDEMIDLVGDPDEPASEQAAHVAFIKRISTFDEADVLTTDKGLVIETADGREFQLTIVRSR